MITICSPDASKVKEYLNQYKINQDFHEPWIRTEKNEDDFHKHLKKYDGKSNAAFWVLKDAKIAGIIHLNNIIREVFQNAFLGYSGSKEFSGKGVMLEGLKLVLKKSFEDFRLHRLECAIQPGNEASLKFIRKFGFHFEGFAPSYLFINNTWCDHFKFSLTKEQWLGTSVSQDKAEILAYQEKWPEQFLKIKEKILQKIAGFPIEHVGSTSVEGLPSKDIIDIQLGVKNFAEVNLWTEDLKRLGFEYVPGINRDHVPFKEISYMEEGWHKRFFRGTINGIKVNLHVRILGSKNWDFALTFRNFLRINPLAKKAYGQVKQRLAESGVSSGIYAYTKDPVCDLIYLHAIQSK